MLSPLRFLTFIPKLTSVITVSLGLVLPAVSMTPAPKDEAALSSTASTHENIPILEFEGLNLDAPLDSAHSIGISIFHPTSGKTKPKKPTTLSLSALSELKALEASTLRELARLLEHEYSKRPKGPEHSIASQEWFKIMDAKVRPSIKAYPQDRALPHMPEPQ